MPNTLVHIGIQGPLNSLCCKGTTPQWVLLGCIIPDIPWISQRILQLVPGINPYSLRLYSVNQASLFFCLLLAAALALATRMPRRIFLVLGLNCLAHLLLDATQLKWANGVHLLVPFSWSMLRFDWLWPEHPLFYTATMVGLLFLAFTWRKTAATDLQLGRPAAGDKGSLPAGRTAVVIGLLLLYGAGPFLFFNQALEADNHFSRTLLLQTERIGKKIELDRASFTLEGKSIRAFTGETFFLRGPLPETSGPTSIQGYFVTPDTIQVTRYHQHNRFRDRATILGLLLVTALWIQSLLRNHFRHQPDPSQQGALP